MNILGVGNLELLWILLLALVLLGPGRLVDAARAAGKFWREAQHTLRSVADAASIDLDAPPPKIVPREPLPSPDDAVARGESDGAPNGEREMDAAAAATRGESDSAAPNGERELDANAVAPRGESDGAPNGERCVTYGHSRVGGNPGGAPRRSSPTQAPRHSRESGNLLGADADADATRGDSGGESVERREAP